MTSKPPKQDINKIILNIETRIADGTYSKNRNIRTKNKGTLKRRLNAYKKQFPLTVKNDAIFSKFNALHNAIKGIKPPLPERVFDADLEDEAENAEMVVGACGGAGAAAKPSAVSRPSASDNYTKEVLQEQYKSHKAYVESRMASAIRLNITIRLPHIPEDISENIVKFILHKLGDITSRWNCSSGDLYSDKELIQECKCFTSNGPLSFSPSTDWNVIYFLDARNWLSNRFTLYRINLRKSSSEWQNINMSKTQTFAMQMSQGRRPRIGWENLYPQVEHFTQKIFEGTFDDIFIPSAEESTEP